MYLSEYFKVSWRTAPVREKENENEKEREGERERERSALAHCIVFNKNTCLVFVQVKYMLFWIFF